MKLDRLTRVHVRESDYTYFGNVVSSFRKKDGSERCVIEDDGGRLSIHNWDKIERI